MSLFSDVIEWTDSSGTTHYYRLSDSALAYSDAFSAAESSQYSGLSGHLVTITSAEEQQFIEQNASVLGFDSNTFLWMGLERTVSPTASQTQPNSSDEILWVTGEQFEYENWVEPAGVNGPFWDLDREYAAITGTDTEPFRETFEWIWYVPTNELNYIIEYEQGRLSGVYFDGSLVGTGTPYFGEEGAGTILLTLSPDSQSSSKTVKLIDGGGIDIYLDFDGSGKYLIRVVNANGDELSSSALNTGSETTFAISYHAVNGSLEIHTQSESVTLSGLGSWGTPTSSGQVGAGYEGYISQIANYDLVMDVSTYLSAPSSLDVNSSALREYYDLTSAVNTTSIADARPDIKGSYSLDFNKSVTSVNSAMEGEVRFWASDALMEGVSVNVTELSGNLVQIESFNSDSNGKYYLKNVPSEQHELSVEKAYDSSEVGNSITAADALSALKLAVGLNPNPNQESVLAYQYMAADVNKDGRVSAADALSILKMAVNIDDAITPSWEFVSEDQVSDLALDRNDVSWAAIHDTLQVNEFNKDLYGVLLGDVNGSFIA